MSNTDKAKEAKLSVMSPFEIKNALINMAKKDARRSDRVFLNAGRGNPNWITSEPRDAFFLLGQFAMSEARRTYADDVLAGQPASEGAGQRLKDFLTTNSTVPGALMLDKAFDYATGELGICPDDLAYEWADGIIGDHYPTPIRMLTTCEQIVRAYIAQEMGDHAPGYGREYDLFATEGGTAAMCYVFDSLEVNHLVSRGDKVALFAPLFTPYIEIPELDRYQFDTVMINASAMDKDGLHEWQYPDSELDKLRDPAIKVACLINPSNPPSYKLSQHCLDYLVDVVKKDNPNLIFISDDVYGTFADDYKSLAYVLPANAICVYSFSKYFGATGWRLAVIALARDNVMNRLIASLPELQREDLHRRYESLTLKPDDIPFIDRMVADSRAVALNHTAGLSTPQQIQMTLFALFCLTNKDDSYKKKMKTIIRSRLDALWKSTGFTLLPDPNRAGYYSEIDLMVWARKFYGDDFCDWLKKTHNPLDIVVRLAKETSVVLLNGSGFAGPDWSVRASLANLDEDAYLTIGKAVNQILTSYYDQYKAEKAK